MTSLHEQRLDEVCRSLKATGAKRVLDLGCGSGSLLYRLLAEPQFELVVGVEQSGLSLAECRRMLGAYLKGDGLKGDGLKDDDLKDDELRGNSPRLKLINASYAEKNKALVGYDVAAMVETIEHVYPRDLSKVELAVFGQYRPAALLMTTPNYEYNPLFDLAEGEFREEDHKFEWTRTKFQQWARGVANRNGYQVKFGGIGDVDPEFGAPTQTAFFTLK